MAEESLDEGDVLRFILDELTPHRFSRADVEAHFSGEADDIIKHMIEKSVLEQVSSRNDDIFRISEEELAKQ